MSTAVSAPSSALCIGRFSLVMPDGWVLNGRTQEIYLTSASDQRRVVTGVGGSATERVLRGDLSMRTPMIREFVLDGAGPAAWFGDAGSSDRRLAVLVGTPESGLRLETAATAGREPMAEKLLTHIAGGYRPQGRTGFCLPNGALQVEASRNEAVRLSASPPGRPAIVLRFSTRTIAQPRSDGPLADPAADNAAMAGSGSSLKSLGATERSVAGHVGRDARAELVQPDKPPQRAYRFFYAGLPTNATAPEINISLDGPSSEVPMLDAAWNQMLNSVRPVPLK